MILFKGIITQIDDLEITIKISNDHIVTLPFHPKLNSFVIGDSITLALAKEFRTNHSTSAADILNSIIKPSK